MITPRLKTSDAFKITGKWKPQAAALKAKFPQLTDADLKFEVDQEDELLTRLETRLKKSREEVTNIIIKGQAPKA